MSSISDSQSQSIMSNTAQVKYHDGHKAPPTMLPGRVTPALLLQWEEHAMAYFDKVKTTDIDKVASILTCWKDPEIDNFIKMHKDRFRAVDFTFPMFITKICKHFLDPLWENNIMRTVVNSKMINSESFSSFANRVIAGNNLLDGTTIRLDVPTLRKTLLGNMSEFLASKIDRLKASERDRLSEIVSFEEWMAEIVSIDREATSDLKRIAEMLKDDISFKHQRTDDPTPNFYRPSPAENVRPLRPSQVYNVQPTQFMRNNPSSSHFVGTGANAVQPSSRPPNRFQKRCPPLPPSEISLLNAHKGCRKCRRFYVAQRVPTCPNGFPDGATYVPLTEEMALEAMRKVAVASTYSPFSMPNTASTSRNVSNDFSFTRSNTPQSSSSFSAAYNNYTAPPALSYSLLSSTPQAPSDFIEDENRHAATSEATTLPSTAVSAILPSSLQSFVIGNGSDSSDIAEDMSPISVPHLFWNATVWNCNDEQIKVKCMLDNGAHLVLIRPKTVASLGLPIHRLTEPICISLALSASLDTVSHFSDYVYLTASSLDNAWTSRPVRALVAPGLCTEILLGLPFLVHNKIVVDHDARTAIDKSSSFDLLNVTRVARPTINRPLSPKQKYKRVLNFRKLMLKELKIRCAQRRSLLERNGSFESVKPFDAIAAIRIKIESLASKNRLDSLERNLKKEFAPIFRPIPHISELPTSETARIQLKDAYKTIATRQYSIPRQFRDNFALLIQQCLDSGFIRPSSSQFASPSFIVPKADPKAIPRWVCDYRQLNENTVPDNFPLPRVDVILADCAKGKIWATIDMTDDRLALSLAPVNR